MVLSAFGAQEHLALAETCLYTFLPTKDYESDHSYVPDLFSSRIASPLETPAGGHGRDESPRLAHLQQCQSVLCLGPCIQRIHLSAPERRPAVFRTSPGRTFGAGVHYIRKPEEIGTYFQQQRLPLPQTLGLESDAISYNEYQRYEAISIRPTIQNGSALLRRVRNLKTDWEIEQIRRSGRLHTQVYHTIPSLYRPGMTDIELSIEHRTTGSFGRITGPVPDFGQSMEIFMGSLLAGDNADTPSPYDFALGGAGQDTSLPVGGNGTPLKEGMAVMVDMGGNFTGYTTDMSRVFSIGTLSDLAYRAHDCSLAIQREIERIAKPGTPAKDLYNTALEMATAAGLADYFMGHNQKAGFVGHGIGIEINEGPVLAPRSKDILARGMVLRLRAQIRHSGRRSRRDRKLVRRPGNGPRKTDPLRGKDPESELKTFFGFFHRFAIFEELPSAKGGSFCYPNRSPKTPAYGHHGREFLKTSLLASAGLALGGLSSFKARSYAHVRGANRKVAVAFIGIGNRGEQLIQDFEKTGMIEVVALCDVDLGAPHTPGRSGQISRCRSLPGFPTAVRPHRKPNRRGYRRGTRPCSFPDLYGGDGFRQACLCRKAHGPDLSRGRTDDAGRTQISQSRYAGRQSGPLRSQLLSVQSPGKRPALFGTLPLSRLT